MPAAGVVEGAEPPDVDVDEGTEVEPGAEVVAGAEVLAPGLETEFQHENTS